MISFGAQEWLWGLLALPVLALLFLSAEKRSTERLRQFVAPRLLDQLGGTVSRFRRGLRFGLLLLGIALALVSLAKPRWGYTFENVKRKGLDLMIAVDTSRSMLANDVAPNRLQRLKLAAQDLLNELQGDRIGLIAFAGRAFVQAPLTIDYDAAAEALNNLDTKIIPEGGTNISEAITLAVNTFGKSAVGNRALIIFTDGEDLAGDSVKLAKNAADAGVRIFTIGVGTPEGSLIPLTSQNGGTAFVKDSGGQVVKSRLDEKRLREIAEATGGKFLPLGNGTASMHQLYADALSKLQTGDIDARARSSRTPIERYQWPLAVALLALMASFLISERKTARRRARVVRVKPVAALTTPALLLLAINCSLGAAPGLDEYRNEKFGEAYERFQQTLKEHPDTKATDKIQFDAGAAAYKMKDYGKALQSFSQALLSPDLQLQSRSHYNLGNTLYEHGDAQKNDDAKLKDWTNALQHYEQTLKLEPENKEAKENYEFVKQKIQELKRKKDQPTPTPTPTPSPSPSPSPSPQDKKDKDKKDQNKQDQDKDKQKDKSGSGGDKDQKQDQSQKDQNKDQQQKPGQSPTPSPSPGEQQPQSGSSPSPSPSPGESPGQGASSSPSPGEQGQASPSPGENGASPSPSPGEGNEGASPTPSPGEGENSGDESNSPAPTPIATPGKKPSGDVKGAGEEQPKDQKAEDAADAEANEDGKMSEKQAERLLKSMRDEEQRVQLDEHKAVRRVYKDW